MTFSRLYIHTCIWVSLLVLAALPARADESALASALERTPILNPNYTAYPESSLLDCSARMDAPAGKYGFVTTKDGHFVFANGKRIRFFGVNIAKDSVFIGKAQIDRLAALFARSGINLVRIHQIDDGQGILSTDRKQLFIREKIDIIDYWVAALKARGIYLCLDLNDYRTFRASEGVPGGEELGRGAKPYAVFSQRIIALQQAYARALLVDHVNPYTRLAYANDPAVALLEIYDENGLFIRRADWANLHEPYQTEFLQAWNSWLHDRYRTTALLKSAWTDKSGACALQAGENLEKGTVQLPKMDLCSSLTLAFTNPLQAPCRVSDGAMFAYDLQTDFLRQMMSHLREIGVKIPVTAVGAQDVLPDLMANAAATDYIGINYYWDHPTWEPGKEWVMPAYFSLTSPISSNTDFAFPFITSAARMNNKPLVIRELGYCFPNPYRGAGMIEAAAYGAFLDIDALILFTYGTEPESRTIGFFDLHLDPLRWGLVPVASRLFLSGEVQPAKNRVGIGYNDVDAFTWFDYGSALYQLGFSTRVENYTNPDTPHPFDLLVTSGRSCGGQWNGDHMLLFANQRHTDLRFQGVAAGMDELEGYHLATGHAGNFPFTFRGIGYDLGVVHACQAWPTYTTDDLYAQRLMPVATSGTQAMGFIDSTRKNAGFRNLRDDLATRVALDLLHEWYAAPVSHADQDGRIIHTDTRQIERDLPADLIRVDTPTLQALAGKFDTPGAMRTSSLHLITSTPMGTLTAESLDGKMLADSANYLVKMTSRARNDQEKVAPSPQSARANRLTSLGSPPISTDGKAWPAPTSVELGGKLLLELYLQNGTWEYLAEPDRALLYLDTADVQIHLPQVPKRVRIYTPVDTLDITPKSNLLTIPNGTRLTEIDW